MKTLIILNDPPYGTERTYNGLRIAGELVLGAGRASVTAFLMGDAVSAGKAGQQTPNGYYNVERMLKGILLHKGSVLLCGTCMDARGIKDSDLIEGCRRSSLGELVELTATSDKTLVF